MQIISQNILFYVVEFVVVVFVVVVAVIIIVMFVGVLVIFIIIIIPIIFIIFPFLEEYKMTWTSTKGGGLIQTNTQRIGYANKKDSTGQ